MFGHVEFCERFRRRGFSIVELLGVVVILGVVAALAVVHFTTSSDAAKRNACYVIKGEIAVQAQLWYRTKGQWPSTNLTSIGADPGYFPEGLPECPVDGGSYTFDTNTQEVIGHVH